MEKYFNDIVNSTVEILKFDSSLKAAEENCPFGKETADCLQYFLSLAESMGFETRNYDNYVGEVVFGEGKDFAILAHLDVVPAGSGWKYPPFGGVINDELSDGDEKTGAKIIATALQAPVRQIAENAGVDGSVVYEKIRSSKKVGFGYNAYTETYCDMIASGIVDPTKVTRSSLENAASIAACVLTTESLVVDKPDPAADAAAAAAASQGGMY